MDVIRIAIVGAGSVRCTPAVIGSLANYYGERPLELRFVDADAERLDLFDRFARLAFRAANSDHHLISTDSFGDALEDADRVILQIGRNCAEKLIKDSSRNLDSDTLVQAAVSHVLEFIPEGAHILNLLRQDFDLPLSTYRLDWNLTIPPSDRASMPHKILRWLREDENIVEYLDEYLHSPLKAWLDNPMNAQFIPGVIR